MPWFAVNLSMLYIKTNRFNKHFCYNTVALLCQRIIVNKQMYIGTCIIYKHRYHRKLTIEVRVRTVYNTTWNLQVYELPFPSLKFRHGVLINAVVGPLPCGPSALLARS